MMILEDWHSFQKQKSSECPTSVFETLFGNSDHIDGILNW